MSWIDAGPVWPLQEPLCSQLTPSPSPLPESTALLTSAQLAFQQTGWHLDKGPGCAPSVTP